MPFGRSNAEERLNRIEMGERHLYEVEHQRLEATKTEYRKFQAQLKAGQQGGYREWMCRMKCYYHKVCNKEHMLRISKHMPLTDDMKR